MTDLSLERLHELLHYNPRTGLFVRKVRAGNSAPVGTIAGGFNRKGYRIIRVDGRRYLASRLAWFYVHGRWPKDEIDHRNGVRDDNRLANLREASHSENQQNRRKAHKSNATGFLGVSPNEGKFRAQIKINGNRLHLGNFATPQEAHAAYVKAKRKLHPLGLL